MSAHTDKPGDPRQTNPVLAFASNRTAAFRRDPIPTIVAIAFLLVVVGVLVYVVLDWNNIQQENAANQAWLAHTGRYLWSFVPDTIHGLNNWWNDTVVPWWHHLTVDRWNRTA